VNRIEANVPSGDETLYRIALDLVVEPIEFSHVAQYLLHTQFVEVFIEDLLYVFMHRVSDFFRLRLLRLRRVAIVERILDHYCVAAVH
jgi:hypothetical protein